MAKPKTLQAGLALFVVCLAAEAGTEDIATSGLVDACAACHGPDGNSPASIPSIAALEPDDLRQLLLSFRSGELESTVMGRLARALTDAEIEHLAKHFSELPPAE